MKNIDVIKYRVSVPYFYYETGEVCVSKDIPDEDVEELILKAIHNEGIFLDFFEPYDEGIDENRFEVDIFNYQDKPDSEVSGYLLKIDDGEPKLEYIHVNMEHKE